jgi:hypothetical protein
MGFVTKKEQALHGPDNQHPYYVKWPKRYYPSGKLIPTPAQLKALENGRKHREGRLEKTAGYVQRVAAKEATKAILAHVNTRQSQSAIDALKDQAVPIIKEIMAIALAPSPMESRFNRKLQMHEVVVHHSAAKMKALALCVERVIPVLKVVEVNEGESRKAHELDDHEIIALMQKMAGMAGNSIEVKSQEELDG